MTGSASIKSSLRVMMLWFQFSVVTAVIVYAGSNLSEISRVIPAENDKA